MNVIVAMQDWLEEQRALISSQQLQFCYLAAAEKITQEEALRNIGELIVQRKTLDKVQTKIYELKTIMCNEAEEEVDRIMSESNEDIPEDGSEDFRWGEEEKEIILPFPEEA